MQRRSTRLPRVTSTISPLSPLSPSRRSLLLAGLGLCIGWRGVRAQDYGSNARRYLYGGMPYDAFDELPTTTIVLPGGKILVAFAPGEFELSKSRVLSWVKSAGETVSQYYGRFPVPLARLLIVPYDGGGVGGGNAFGYGGAAIRLRLGQYTNEYQLDHDWVLVHEMVHLAFPSVPQRHHWIEEGLATYVEGIARVQAGRNETIAEIMAATQRWNYETAAKIFRQGQERGNVRRDLDVESIAVVVTAILDGAVSAYLVNEHAFDVERFLDAAVDAIVRMLRP